MWNARTNENDYGTWNTAFKDIASEKAEEDEDNTYFIKAISVVIIGGVAYLIMLNEIKGERRSEKRQVYMCGTLRNTYDYDIGYIEVHSLNGVWNGMGNVKAMNTTSF